MNLIHIGLLKSGKSNTQDSALQVGAMKERRVNVERSRDLGVARRARLSASKAEGLGALTAGPRYYRPQVLDVCGECGLQGGER